LPPALGRRPAFTAFPMARSLTALRRANSRREISATGSAGLDLVFITPTAAEASAEPAPASPTPGDRPPAQPGPPLREIRAILRRRRTPAFNPAPRGHADHVHPRHGALSVRSISIWGGPFFRSVIFGIVEDWRMALTRQSRARARSTWDTKLHGRDDPSPNQFKVELQGPNQVQRRHQPLWSGLLGVSV